MNNNYEYVQKLKQNLEEQEKIKKELKKELDFLLIPNSEKENLITNILNTALETYSPTTILSFNKFIKTKLRKEVDKLYFNPSSIIPIEEQKIIYLYLTQENNHFLTEEEIRKRLRTNSGNIYNVLKKLKTKQQKISDELKKLFPDYEKQLTKRKKEQQTSSTLSETDLRYLGYYIGEINDICLGIDEIARKEGKKESEIQESLKSTFNLLKEKEGNIELIKTRYPNCEKMLQIKATNFGIKLYANKEEKEEDNSDLKQKQQKRKKESKPQKEKSLLTEKKEKPLLNKKQETMLKELAKNSDISKIELANLIGYKNPNSICTALNILKKKCETNGKVKIKVLELYPDFLTLKPKPKKEKSEKKEKPLLTKKQETMLKELAKNPNIQKKQLAEITGYKNQKTLCQTISILKKKCESNEELKEKVLVLFPDFLMLKPKPKKEKSEKKEKPLLNKKQETMLKELAKNPNITKKQLAEITGYKNQKTLYQTISILKKKCESNEELKTKVLELFPDFLTPKPKPEKKQPEKQEKSLLTKRQEILLTELRKNPNIPKKELAEITGYKNQKTLYQTISILKKKCESNEELKEKVLVLFPDFLTPKPKPEKKQPEQQEKSLLTKRQEILLTELRKNPNIPKKQLAEITGYKNLYQTISILKKKCESNEELKEKVLELFPDFLTPKPKPEKKQPEKQEKSLLTKKQEVLLKELAKNPNIPGIELVKLTEYKNPNSIWTTLNTLKKKCKTNEEVKAKVLELYPDFLNPKSKQNQKETLILTEQELQILQSIYLITPPKTSYITYEQLSSELQYSNSYIHHIKKKALEKIKSTPEIKEEIQEIWPSFEQDKIIREHYKKRRSIKIPSQDLEKIKSFIRQYDIPENNVQEEKRNNILIGIHNLENSIFSSYVSKCTEEQKAMLALRLGFINAPATTEIVAELFDVEQQEVITLTKKCLQSAKPTLTAKTYQKKKEN